MRQTNFGYIVRKKSQYYPAKTAIVDQETRAEYSYREIENRSNSIARELQSRSIGEGDRVCGLFRNSVEFFDLFFATSKIGAVAAPLNFRLSPPELADLVEDCDPDLFVFEGVFEDKVEDMSIEDRPKAWVGGGERDIANTDSFENFYEHDPSEVPIESGFEETAILLYTSGSTGRPKGVPISHKNLFFSSVSWIVDTELSREDVTVVSSPIFHVGGINEFTLSLVHTGGTLILQKEFKPEETWDVIVEYDVTKLFAITTMLNTMTKVDGWRGRDLTSLDFIVTGGEPVPSKLRKKFLDIGIPCVAAYGATETTDGSLIVRKEEAEAREPEVAGRTFTHIDAKIVDEDGNEVEQGEEGELMFRGPIVTEEYFGLPEKTEQTWENGWIHTRDIAKQDEDGFYHVLGRVDNMIISGGENIYPGEVEEPLHPHPDIKEVVVLGIPDEKWGEAVKAVIVPKGDAELTVEDVSSCLDGKLAGFKHPKYIEHVDELPTGATGKIERKTVQDMYTPE